MAAARVGYDMADEQNRKIRWCHVALVKALLTSDSEKEMQTWFSVGRETVFQTMISGDSGKLNTKCYISPESAKSEFSDSGIRFCTKSSMFQLQAVFRFLGLS